MLKKTITFEDYDGNKRSEDFYFNLTKAELIRMNFMAPGGMDNRLKKIVQERDNHKILKAIEDFIGMSYGEKSEDGRRFVKSDEITEQFKATPAYSELLMELLSDEQAFASFINGIVPSDVAEAVTANAEAEAKKTVEDEKLIKALPAT